MKNRLFAAVCLFVSCFTASAQIASDVASNYGGGWTSGTNGGFGFGNWTLTTGGNGSAGFFTGDPAAAGLGALPNPSFGLFANPSSSTAFANADRPFAAPLNVGETFTITLGMNFDSGGPGNKGLNIYSGGTGGTQLININMGSSATITINGNPMFTSYGTVPMTLNFEYVNATTLRVFGNGRDGVQSFNGNFTISGAPNAFRVYASSLDSPSFTDQRQPYFNNLIIVPEPSTLAFLAAGLAGLALPRRKRKI